MFLNVLLHLILGFFTISVIIADPGPTVNSDSYDTSTTTIHIIIMDIRSQQQLQTPSPYLNKRNPNSNNSDSQQSYSSVAAPSYGNVPTRSSANQCKLHINCPSKRKT